MRLLARLVVAVIANALGLWLANQYLSGFVVATDPRELLVIAAILMVLNATLKPVLELFLGPIIVLTLGLGYLLVNGIVLYILDILFETLSIQTVPALLLAGLIIGVINFIFHLATKK